VTVRVEGAPDRYRLGREAPLRETDDERRAGVMGAVDISPRGSDSGGIPMASCHAHGPPRRHQRGHQGNSALVRQRRIGPAPQPAVDDGVGRASGVTGPAPRSCAVGAEQRGQRHRPEAARVDPRVGLARQRLQLATATMQVDRAAVLPVPAAERIVAKHQNLPSTVSSA